MYMIDLFVVYLLLLDRIVLTSTSMMMQQHSKQTQAHNIRGSYTRAR